MTGPLDAEAVRMGRRIRELRTAQGLTMVELAGRVDMSQSFLSLAERGHTRLSLASMGRIAKAFGLRPGALLAQDPESRFGGDGLDVVRGAHTSRSPRGPRDSWQLAQAPGGLSGIEFVDSNPDFGEYAVHDEDEWIYLLDGILEVAVPGVAEVQSLARGDSATFAGGTAHAWRSGSAEPFRVLVVTAPSGAQTVVV